MALSEVHEAADEKTAASITLVPGNADEAFVEKGPLSSISSSLDSDKENWKEKFADPDVDDALKFLETREKVIYTTEQNQKLLWKIDVYLLPILGVLFMFQFLDKTTISYASVMNIIPDTGLVGNQYNWLGSAFYIGQLVAEFPANLALQRLRLAKFLSTQILLWGGVLMIHAACSNFGGLVTVRIMLGIFESSVAPAFIMIVSQWWRKEEQGFRTGILFCCSGFGQIFGAVVSYAIAIGIRKSGYTTLAGWQIMFLFTGSLTILIGIVFFFMIPDSPASAWFLSEEEKVMAIERIRSNQQGVGNKHLKKHQVIEALKDPFTWLLFIFSITTNIPIGALTTFKNIILQGFGLSKEHSLLYGAPSGAVQVASTILICWLADRMKIRIYGSIFAMMIPILGYLLMVTLPQGNLGGQLAAFYITNTSSAASTLVLSMISSNVAGQSKKSTVIAIHSIGYCVGNLIGPQIINLKDAPRFITAKTILCVLYSFGVVLLLMMRMLFLRRNAAKEKKRAELGESYQPVANQEFMDMTDFENLDFKYVV